MPYLIVDDAVQFIDFTEKVFNANLAFKGQNPDGSIAHCEVQIEGCTIMFGNSSAQWPARTGDLFVYVPDADAAYQRALEHGATSVMEPDNRDYGRSGGIKDAFGNIWWITSIQ